MPSMSPPSSRRGRNFLKKLLALVI